MAYIQKRANGSYHITVCDGYDNSKRKIRHIKVITAAELQGLTPRQAEKKVNEKAVLFEQTVKSGAYISGEKITLESFAEKWLADYAQKQLAPRTVDEYKRLLKLRIIPALGGMALGKLQPMHLMAFYNRLAEPGTRMDGKAESLSQMSILHYHQLISAILNAAVQWQLIGSNPCERVKPPKAEKKEARHYDDGEVIAMFRLLSAEPLKYQAAIYIALYGGLRLGEVTGLNWNDVDFSTGIMHITKASQYLRGKGIFDKSTKNVTSTRKISLSGAALKVLQLYKMEQDAERKRFGDGWTDSGKIFVQRDGKPMFPSTPSNWFRDWLKAKQLPPITFHQLRHTNASLLIAQGVDIATVSKRLGHAKISTTTDIYTHAVGRVDKVAADALDDLLNREKQPE